MSNNKQTAVAWLYKKLAEILCDVEVNAVQAIALFDTLKQAKEMEKQQIVKAAQDNFYAGQDLAKGYKIDWNSAEQYYNETFGGNNEQQ